MIPVVALVGRPNVGKSTLFNRLTRTRDALVADFPGLTRDRKYGRAEVEGREFICIDTGGIDGTEEGVETRMAEQSLLAIEEADVVLFMVDARAGLMPADIAIAKHLRSREKPTFLVANKTDGIDVDQAMADFWSLGLGDIYPIAASHGRGVTSLLEQALLPWVDEISPQEEVDEDAEYWAKFEAEQNGEAEEEPEDDFNPQDLPIKLAIVGRPNVGKSTLTNRILGEDRVVVYDMPGTTRDSIYIPMQRDEREYVLIDTAGVRKKAHWNSNQTYLQRPIPQLNSIVSGGQIFTNGEFFDTIGLRGVNLSTDDNMFPDGMRSYAPEIRGVAQSNALVTVRQGSNIIYQTTVPPGPFTLQDVYPSGYGSDLEVSVKEADGSVEVFSVPYASVAQLLRPGMTRYALSAGKVDDSSLRNKPMLYQATWQHGINNLLTGYTGVTGFDDYQAFLVGTGMNTGIGALSFDVTHSRLKSDTHDDSGQSYRATFNRMFTDTQTSIVLAAYRYSTKGYYNLNDALYAVDQEKNSRSNYTLWRQKNGMTFTVNQNLPDGWGGFYLSGRVSDYWNRSGTEKQYQVSYNNSFGRLSWSASAQRVYTPDSSGHRRDDRISLNFSYPLWFGDNRTANLTSNTSFNNSRFASSQIGINGSLDSENNLNYGVSTTTATGGQHDVALNGSYRTPWTTLNGSYSQGEGYRQSGLGASGTMIAHSGGVVLSPESGSTMALIEAKDAAGAMLPGSPGTRVDSNGYAILPYLRPYRINAVEIDPKGSLDDVAFDRTVAQVVPWEGSVVKVAFGTTVQNNLTLQVRQANHEPLPFAASIFSPDGKEIGVVGQGSMMFISDANAKRAIVKWSGGQCSVDLGPQTTKDSVCR